MNYNLFELLQQNTRAETTLIASTQMTMSAAEFLDFAARLASLISQQDESSDLVVAIDLEPELQALAIFACYNLGVASLQFRADLELMTQAGVKLVLTQNSERETGGLKKLVMNQQSLELLAKLEPAKSKDIKDPTQIANMFFSSGTTGLPKIVAISIGELLEREAFLRPARIRGKYMSLLGLGTFGGFMTMFSQLINGQPFFTPKTAPLNARVISNWGIDTIFGSPAQLEELLKELKTKDLKVSIKEVQSTGNGISVKLAKRLGDELGSEVTNAYASTEAGIVAMKTGSWDDDAYCGDVLAGVEIQIVSDSQQVLGDGQSGEIRIKAPGQAKGYMNNPAASATQFVDGWFYPGDLGIKRGNALYLLGRKTEMINAGGVKVNPAALDELAREYAGIEDAAMFSFETVDGVQASALAFVSATPPKPELLKLFLQRKFGEATPNTYYRVASIPRNELGKPMRAALATQFEAARKSK